MNEDELFCPACPPQMRTQRRRIKGEIVTEEIRWGIRLVLVEDNFHGTGVDLFSCPQCEKDFWVSYKIDKVEEVI